MISEAEIRREREMLAKELADSVWSISEEPLIKERIDTLNYVLAEGDWEWKAEE